MRVQRRTLVTAAAGVAAAGLIAGSVAATHSGIQPASNVANVSAAPAVGRPSVGPGVFLGRLHTVRTIGSTVPGNGDVNPYGIVALRHTNGRLHAGNILISNFNNKANLQGTGSTIVQITPRGHQSVFAHITKGMLTGRCPGGIGLSTALVVLPGGWVVVGSAPSANGQAATAKAGCLIILNNQGRVRETLSGSAINGPWDATAVSNGSMANVFITNAFNGTAAGKGKIVHKGTVARIALRLAGSAAPRPEGTTVIATGLAEQASPAAFVLGPTGLGLGGNGRLYVADTANSTITVIPNAMGRNGSSGPGMTVTRGGALLQPLGLTIAPNGDILTVNGGNGKIVETTPGGQQIATEFLDNSGSPAGAGALFGVTVAPGGVVYFVDDAANTLRVLKK